MKGLANRYDGRGFRAWALAAVACFLFAAAPAIAGGGTVMPPTAKPKGYSLAEAAAATADFNVDVINRTPENVPAGFPFQILYLDPEDNTMFNIRPGTMLYVPIVYSDSTDGAVWDYPNVNDPDAVSDYYFDPKQLGTEFIDVIVDGKKTTLGPKYAVGAVTPALPTGGQAYTVVGAFLTPLSKGLHTMTIQGRLSGVFIVESGFFPGGVFDIGPTTYTVNVR